MERPSHLGLRADVRCASVVEQNKKGTNKHMKRVMIMRECELSE